MRILHIATGFPLSYQGGITNYVRSLAFSQYEAGEDVSVLGGPDSEAYPFPYIEYASDKILPFSFSKMEDTTGLSKISKILDDKIYDIIHIHMMLDVDKRICDILQNKCYVVSLHDYFFLCPRIQMVQKNKKLCAKYSKKDCSKCISRLSFNDKFMRVWCKSGEIFNNYGFSIPKEPSGFRQSVTEERFLHYKKLLEKAQIVLPVSNRVKEIYEDSGIDAKYKVLHIGNVTADSYKNDFKFDHNNRKIIIVMLGSLSYLKGADIFFNIVRNTNHDKAEFHFYGRVSDEYRSEIEALGVINHGKYNQNDLINILNHADIGLVLSVWEDNAPQVVMEMLNNHVPVIGTKMGGIPDFVNSQNGFLFDPYNEKEVKDVINFINEITLEEIYKLKCNIKPTITPESHLKMLEKIYEESSISFNRMRK